MSDFVQHNFLELSSRHKLIDIVLIELHEAQKWERIGVHVTGARSSENIARLRCARPIDGIDTRKDHRIAHGTRDRR